MKKKFKTILALTAALAVSMSSMCMTSAEDVVDTDGDGVISSAGNFYVTTIDRLSASITTGAMKLVLDLKTNKWTDDSFDGENNKIFVKNTSSCDVDLTYEIKLTSDQKEEVYVSGFRLTNVNKLGELGEGDVTYCIASMDGEPNSNFNPVSLSPKGETEAYLTLAVPDTYECYEGVGFNEEQIGQVTVTMVKSTTLT